MGSKTKARELMQAAGVPIVPGTTEAVETVEDALKIADKDIGYPVAVKAAGGGGGKGFRVALTEDELQDAFEGASREGEKFFSDATRLPRALPARPAPRRGPGPRRHARQRHPPRRARLLDPAPPPEAHRGGAGPAVVVDEELREQIGKIGVDAAKAVDYVGAGTIEGLLQDGEYFFLEMNTRVQVEHCVTEMVDRASTSSSEGIQAAAGEELDLHPGRRRPARPRDRVPHQRRGRVEELRPGARARSATTRSRPARACAWTPASAPAARSRRCTTRWSPS